MKEREEELMEGADGGGGADRCSDEDAGVGGGLSGSSWC